VLRTTPLPLGEQWPLEAQSPLPAFLRVRLCIAEQQQLAH